MQLPIARTTELIEQEADKELLIYDLRINRAYTLNETSKTVFQACNGKTSFDELKRKYNYTDDLIYLTLDELKKNELVDGDYKSPFAGMSRREVIRRVGFASMVALPVISGLIAPHPIHAASNGCIAADSVCRAAGTIYCPPNCNETINLINYLTSNNDNCSGAQTPSTTNCANPAAKNLPASYDYKRVS